MIELSPIAKVFNNLFPNRPGNLDRKLLAVAGQGLAATRAGTEEALWAKMRGLIRSGANVNADLKDGASVLGTVCTQQLPLVARHLIEEAGADVNHKNSRGNTPLMLAAWAANLPAMQALIDNKADPTLKNNEGNDAAYKLIYGIGNQYAEKNPIQRGECLKLLLAHGAALGRSDAYHVFHKREEIGFAIPDVVNAKALLSAAEGHRLKDLQKLLDTGIDPDLPGKFATNPPLYYAAKDGDLQMIEMLRKAGADPKFGHPVLLVAAEHGQRDAFKALLDMGADPKAEYPGNKTIFDYARESSDSGMEAYIKDLLAEHNAPATVLGENIKAMPKLRFKTPQAV